MALKIAWQVGFDIKATAPAVSRIPVYDSPGNMRDVRLNLDSNLRQDVSSVPACTLCRPFNRSPERLSRPRVHGRPNKTWALRHE